MPTLAVTTNNEISMAGKWFSKLLRLTTVAAMIAGCAHQPADPTATAPQTDASAAPAATIDPSNPADIMALGERLTGHRLALFSVSQGKYTFYAGGILSASYETATKILRISSLAPTATAAQTCEYTPQGALFVDPKDQTDKDAFVNDCHRLAERLNDYLSR